MCNVTMYNTIEQNDRLRLFYIFKIVKALHCNMYSNTLIVHIEILLLSEPMLQLFSNMQMNSVTVNALNDADRGYLRMRTQTAEFFSERAFSIDTEINNKAGEGRAINNVGNIYYQQGQHEIAIANYHIALHVRHSIGDLTGSASTLNNISNKYNRQIFFHKALEYAHQSLHIYQSLRDNKGLTLAKLFLILIVALVVFIFFRQSKIRKRSNAELRIPNASILCQNRNL